MNWGSCLQCCIGTAVLLVTAGAVLPTWAQPASVNVQGLAEVLANVRHERELVHSGKVRVQYELKTETSSRDGQTDSEVERWEALTTFSVEHDAVVTRYSSNASPRRNAPLRGENDTVNRASLPYIAARLADKDVVLDPYRTRIPQLMVYQRGEPNIVPHVIDPRLVGFGFFPSLLRGLTVEDLSNSPFPHSQWDSMEVHDELLWLVCVEPNRLARNVIVVDPQKGWAPVRCFFEKGRFDESTGEFEAPAEPFIVQDVDWKRLADIWVPVSVELKAKRGAPPRGERPTRENMKTVTELYTIKLSWEEANSAIPAETFSWHNWGLPAGLKVFSGPSEASPGELLDIIHASAVNRGHFGRTVMIASLFVFCIASVLLWRRYASIS